MMWQAFGPLRQAVGPDIGRCILTISGDADADAMFDVDDVIAFCRIHPDEAFATLATVFGGDETFSFIPIWVDQHGWETTIAPQAGVTVTPAAGKSLVFLTAWRLVWLVKTASNSFSADGDLVDA